MASIVPGKLNQALQDRYRLERELGQGGMASVYLAQDVRHDRKVALKVLRPELSAVIGAERFLAEIKVTANLQHPHILPLHDSGEADGFLFYVMPFVEGESLRDRLTREKQLAVDEAVRIATEVASALDYAHRHGVVHRDIKPENILLHDGAALVADFGIALAVSTAGRGRMTETGMSLGTPYYMSPEQAMGEREITGRSDVYSLGCVLYEMLTGDPPFTGSTAQAVVARVVTETPRPLLPQRHTVPPHVEAAVLKALEKLPADRFATPPDFSAALGSGAAPTIALPRRLGLSVPGRRWWNPLSVATTAIASGAIAAGLWGWLARPPRPVSRFNVVFPRPQRLALSEIGPRIALSPDGTTLVYVGPGEGGGRLWVRPMDQLTATPVAGTEGAREPFFSPDGRQVGFLVTTTFTLKVASLDGAPPVTLADTGMWGGGATWGRDGYIYFDTPEGIRRMKAIGGPREPVVTIDTARKEVGHAWPDVLPNGKGILYRLRHVGQDAREYDIMVAELATGKGRALVRGVIARYVSTGHLVYVTADGKLLVSPFDQNSLKLTGSPTVLLDGISVRELGAVDLALSRTGTLAYVPGAAGGSGQPVWVTREGQAQAVDSAWRGSFDEPAPALSPDGKWLALTVGRVAAGGGGTDIWVKRLDAGPFSRLTFDGTTNIRPSWSSDGRDVLFVSDREGVQALYRKRADGSGPPGLIVRESRGVSEGFISPDGRWNLLRTLVGTPGNGDILGLRRGDSVPTPLVATKFAEIAPTLSPDGRWLAYVSIESGRGEVYVRPFPDVNQARWQVSRNGGTEPRWAHSGRELFYRNLNGEMVAQEVTLGPAFAGGQERVLFSAVPYAAGVNHRGYDLSANDRRFLMIRTQESEQDADLVMVLNWFEELRAKMRH
jgi:eukaryotic-like serine/threonine-protein kinase